MRFVRGRVVCPQCGKIWKYMSMNGEVIQCGSCGREFKLAKIEDRQQNINAEAEVSEGKLILIGVLLVGWLCILCPPNFYFFRWLGLEVPEVAAFIMALLEIVFFLVLILLLFGKERS